MSNKKSTKNKSGRPSTGVSTKSKGKNGIVDITREITGIDDYSHPLFESKRKDVERTIKKLRKVSDIPKEIKLDDKNFKEFSKLIGKIINNDELKEINNRITNTKKKETLEDYDTMIKLMSDIVNERADNDYEKKIINRHIESNYREVKIISEIRTEINRLLDELNRASEVMILEESTKCFMEIRDKLNGINNDLHKNVEMYRLLQERINIVSEKYPDIKKLDKIDITDLDSLPIDFVGEVLGLPTTKDIENIIKEQIENGEIEVEK
ncbi:hypothetical protein [Clostridium tertium]|uniref:hypothetical protein n=1 Tax=Clostridium tertium TaxID=1559 RepID=UPI0035644DDF